MTDRLPPGERLLWQGSPDWRLLALELFHVRLLAVYVGLVVATIAASGIWHGAAIAGLLAGAKFAAVGALSLGALVLYAWALARSTVFSITTARITVEYGVAIDKSINLPFARIASAALRRDDAGNGDILLGLVQPNRIARLALWPFVRPWHFAQSEPMLRGLRDVETPAGILMRALPAACAAAAAPAPAPTLAVAA